VVTAVTVVTAVIAMSGTAPVVRLFVGFMFFCKYFGVFGLTVDVKVYESGFERKNLREFSNKRFQFFFARTNQMDWKHRRFEHILSKRFRGVFQ
jgi:hypothetical protein